MGSWCCEGSGSVRDSSLTRATAGSGSEHTSVPVQMVMGCEQPLRKIKVAQRCLTAAASRAGKAAGKKAVRAEHGAGTPRLLSDGTEQLERKLN